MVHPGTAISNMVDVQFPVPYVPWSKHVIVLWHSYGLWLWLSQHREFLVTAEYILYTGGMTITGWWF